MRRTAICLGLSAAIGFGMLNGVAHAGQKEDVDVSAYRAASGVAFRQAGTQLHLRWPIADDQHGVLVLQLQADRALIEELGIAKSADGPSTPLLR